MQFGSVSQKFQPSPQLSSSSPVVPYAWKATSPTLCLDSSFSSIRLSLKDHFLRAAFPMKVSFPSCAVITLHYGTV